MQIYKAMLAVLSDLAPIAKESVNQHFRYNFRGIDAVYREVNPLFKKHGIFCTSKILSHNIAVDGKTATATVIVEYAFHAEDGSSVSTQVLAMGADTGDKAANKALSAAHKYALLQAFVVPCEGLDEQDGEGFEYGKQAKKSQAPTQQAAAAKPPATTTLTLGKEALAELYTGTDVQKKYMAAQATLLKKVANGTGYTQSDILRGLSDRAIQQKVRMGDLNAFINAHYNDEWDTVRTAADMRKQGVTS
jgi:hypothetical protein